MKTPQEIVEEEMKNVDKYFCTRCEKIRSVCFHEKTDDLKDELRTYSTRLIEAVRVEEPQGDSE